MSAVKILVDRVFALSQFVGKGVLYNINYLPDTILGGIVLFSLLLQSAPLAILGISLFSLEFIHVGVSQGLVNAIPGLRVPATNVERCSGHFPGISYERATATLLDQGTLKNISVAFPSYYMMFFGALFAYMFAMAETYRRELEGMPQKRAGIYAGVIIMGILTLMFLLHRIFSGCDSTLSVIIGALIGIAYGYGVELLVASLSGNTLTNLMNVPLIRDRATDGKFIYVCKKS